MAKKAVVILADGFEELEAISVIDILRRANIDTTVAGLDKLNIKGSHGVIISADKILDESGDYDACVFPGGMQGATNLSASEKVKKLIQKMNSANKIIAAICASPVIVLGPSSILKNRHAVCYPGMEKEFPKDVKYKDSDVVIDGNIITSRGPATAVAFALAIVQQLAGKVIAENVRKAILAK